MIFGVVKMLDDSGLNEKMNFFCKMSEKSCTFANVFEFLRYNKRRRDAGVVDRGGLENR